jgi:SpoVK/Ycf46/Vps4 family AAA+-type ATPase
LYVPLPDYAGRSALLQNLLKKEEHELSLEDIESLTRKIEGYSGADIRALCTEAAFGPIRDLTSGSMDIKSINPSAVRPISAKDFEIAMFQVRPSVSQNDLQQYEDWNKLYGSFSITSDSRDG